MFQHYNLKTRMLISIGSVIIGAFIVTNLIVILNVALNTTKQAMDKTKEMSGHYSNEIRENIDEALVAARTMAEFFEGMKKSQSANRDGMNHMLRQVLEENKNFTGVWTCWEPNALDGQDSKNINKPGHDSTGRFVPYWSRDISGNVTLAPLLDYTTKGPGDYYLLARNSGDETIINPYIYEVSGQKVLMTSLVVPIRYDGRVVGVTGIDVAMDTLLQRINQIKPYDTGYASLIANNLIYVTHPNPERVGKKVENAEEIRGSKMVISSNSGEIEILKSVSSTLHTNVYRAFDAIHFGKTKTPWVFVTNSPVNRVLASVRQVTWISIIFSIITLGLLTLVVLTATNSIANPLTYIISSLNNGAAQISVASGQLSSSAQQLSQGSVEQASAIEETSSTLQESTSMLQQNTANTKQAAQLSQLATESSDKGRTEMQEMMDSIQEINKSSDQIGKIVKVIDEIAFQTNILALNAAIEAARAGESGMGFAVVAEEVRNLAGRCAAAAKETTDMIASNIELSGKGVAVAEKVRRSLSEITDNTKKVNELLAEISAASQEQVQGAEQVNRAIQQIESVTQQNAASAEESASSAEELSAQAVNMNQIVGELSKLVNGCEKRINKSHRYYRNRPDQENKER
ncbi:MAG TPA: hypothetical protein DDW65_02010 [Firmicutes bacterium]|nr:hypothetical protein [Bacillota bacterium]